MAEKHGTSTREQTIWRCAGDAGLVWNYGLGNHDDMDRVHARPTRFTAFRRVLSPNELRADSEIDGIQMAA